MRFMAIPPTRLQDRNFGAAQQTAIHLQRKAVVACDSATATATGVRLPNRVSGVASGFPSRKAAGYWVNTIRQGLTEGQSGKTTNQRFLSGYGQNHTAAGLWLTQKISRAHQLRQLSGVQLS
jgi:hypothetical protein